MSLHKPWTQNKFDKRYRLMSIGRNNISILWKLMKIPFVFRVQISKVVSYLIMLFFPCELNRIIIRTSYKIKLYLVFIIRNLRVTHTWQSPTRTYDLGNKQIITYL